MSRLLPWILLSAIALSSCAKFGKQKIELTPSPYGSGGVPPKLRRGGSGGGASGTATAVGPTASQALQLTPEEDIVFTNPDGDENVPELATILAAAPKRKGPWEESETRARKLAAREGKPLLIWFTDSARSPMCKALSQELFSKPEFGKWANEKLVRLRIDSNVQVDDPDIGLNEKETLLIDMKSYVKRLKKQYKVLGNPNLILLNPSGEVVGRYRGYKRGEADYLWGRIKQGEVVSSKAYQDWRASLEKKGYREWRDKKGRKVFAKLTGYSDGTLTLIEPDGNRCKTDEKKLSKEDRAWIDQQKKLRGL